MDFDPLDIEGQRAHRATQEKRTALARQNDEDDMRWLMAQKRGRRIMSRLIGLCGVYRSSFTGNSETFFREGQRNIGLMLVADAQLSPEDFVKMLKEHSSASAGDNGSSRDN